MKASLLTHNLDYLKLANIEREYRSLAEKSAREAWAMATTSNI
jgi:hypothetical protein